MEQTAKIDDLIAQLVKIRDQHGNLPVVQSGDSYDGSAEAAMMNLDTKLFTVVASGDADFAVAEAVAETGHEGPVLEVRIEM